MPVDVKFTFQRQQQHHHYHIHHREQEAAKDSFQFESFKRGCMQKRDKLKRAEKEEESDLESDV